MPITAVQRVRTIPLIMRQILLGPFYTLRNVMSVDWRRPGGWLLFWSMGVS